MSTIHIAKDILHVGTRLETMLSRSSSWEPSDTGAVFTIHGGDLVRIAEQTGIGFLETHSDVFVAVNAPGMYQYLDTYGAEDEMGDELEEDPEGEGYTTPPNLDGIPNPIPIGTITDRDVLPRVEIAANATVAAAQTPLPPVVATNFKNLFAQHMSHSIGDHENVLLRLRMDIDSRLASLVAAQRNLNSHIHRANGNYDLTLYNKIADAIERTKQCDDVVSIGHHANYLIIKTKEISTANLICGHRRKIGNMLIGFNVQWLANPASFGMNRGNDATVRVWNLDREFDNYQCGHVHDTYPCLGGYLSQLAVSAAEGQIDQMVEIMLRFLKNPEPEDGYCTHLRHWPIAEHDDALDTTNTGEER